MTSFKSTCSAFIAFGVIGTTACGSDSTGPTDLDSVSALSSLAIGLQGFGTSGAVGTFDATPSFSRIAPFLDQVNVQIGGADQKMYALGIHESFPPGTCEEVIFGNILPPEPTCTPVPLTLVIILWQSRSASEPPDRMALLVGDVGTSTFDFNIDSDVLPAVGFYLEGENDAWVSQSGMLTSSVAATSQTCSIPLPPYAKSGACSIATFDEQGTIVFEQYDENGASGRTQKLAIPRQTLHGLWMAISEVQPIGLTATRLVPRDLMRRLHSR
jgi:hypothetical protein